MIYVDPEWTYRQAVSYIRILKSDYVQRLSLFSIWQPKERADYILETRDKFYKLKLQEWQIENLWKYMNNYLPYSVLVMSSSRFK